MPICIAISFEIMFSSLLLGLAFIYFFKAGSPANINDANASIHKLIHNKCVTFNGASIPIKGQIAETTTAATFIVNCILQNLRILLYNVLPYQTAFFIELKLSSKITNLLASLATSVPDPIAKPTSAALSAGASFAPSPVIPTTKFIL